VRKLAREWSWVLLGFQSLDGQVRFLGLPLARRFVMMRRTYGGGVVTLEEQSSVRRLARFHIETSMIGRLVPGGVTFTTEFDEADLRELKATVDMLLQDWDRGRRDANSCDV
jgi:hypothetical protein